VKCCVFAEARCEIVTCYGTIPPSACSADTSLYTREALEVRCENILHSAFCILFPLRREEKSGWYPHPHKKMGAERPSEKS